MQESVYKTPVRDISDLKERIIDTHHRRQGRWSMESATACMRQGEGHHLEHLL